VTFDIDANGIVNVGAKDQATSRQQSITITGSGTLDKTEIERMVHDAESHAEDDKKRKELAEVRNTADSLAYQVEKQITDLGDKLNAADKATLEQGVKEVRDAAQTEDVAAIRTTTQNLQNQMMQISQRIYEAAGAAAGTQQAQDQGPQDGAAGAQRQPGGDDVIDAEYKEK
jgi:molecular chaperone DnaK